MKVICNIMSSVDGRLLPSRWTAPANGAPQGELLGQFAAVGNKLKTDAWMWGKATLTEVFPGKFIASMKGGKSGMVYHAPRHSQRMFVVVDPDANVEFTSHTLRGDDILTVIPDYTPCDYQQFLRQMGISYLMVPDTSDLDDVFSRIEQEFALHTIALQGGGVIDGAALAQGVLDELSLVIYPGIDGKSGIPSIFEFVGQSANPAGNQTLELTHVEQLDYGVVWLRYKVMH